LWWLALVIGHQPPTTNFRVQEKHFPFSILHFSFAIEEVRLIQWQMKNVISKMENIFGWRDEAFPDSHTSH
jgi:hypothetical protein